MQDKQNPYIDIHHSVNKKKVLAEHARLEHAYEHTVTYTLSHPTDPLPDVVFTANAGLCLPRLPHPMMLLPKMKYPQRQAELPYLTALYAELNLPMIPFPGPDPFEGQAELKWFHGGTKAVCGYGHRSTRQSFVVMKRLFERLYGRYHLAPPELLVLPLASEDYYHLDVAMLDYSDTDCIVHRRAFSPASLARLRQFLGASHVHVLDTEDSFCLNAVVEGPKLITHTLTTPLRAQLESITGKTIHEVDTKEFEKSGGSVRCMTLDVFS